MDAASLDPESKYSEILKQNGILDEILKVTISEPMDLIGEQFGSIIDLVTIEFKDQKREDYHFFVKKSLPVPDPSEKDTYEQVMLREAFYIKDFVQEMKDFCIKRIG